MTKPDDLEKASYSAGQYSAGQSAGPHEKITRTRTRKKYSRASRGMGRDSYRVPKKRRYNTIYYLRLRLPPPATTPLRHRLEKKNI